MKKFSAKSIVALTAAMAVVTVGGVYAAWYYTSTSGADLSDTLQMNVETGYNNSVQGEYSYLITYGNTSNTRVYHIDQYTEAQSNTYYNGNYKIGTSYNGGTNNAPSTPDNHTAALCVDEDTSFTVYFQAGSGADTDTWYYGVQTTITLSVSSGYYLYSTDWAYSSTYDATNYPYAMFGVNSSCTLGIYDGTAGTLTITINPTTGSGNTWTADANTAGLFSYTFSSDELLSMVSLDYMVVPTYDIFDTQFKTVAAASTLDFAINEVV